MYNEYLVGTIEDINIAEISVSKFNARSYNSIDKIAELADSIRKNGILHPITVRIKELGFEIVAGNRRYSACKKLGWRKIPCHITDIDDKTAYEISIVENVQRKTLDAVEEAIAFRKYVVDYGWGGAADLAERLSKSPSYISKRIKLTELPAQVLELISDSELPVTAAEELLYLKRTGERSRLANLISTKKISTRNVRQLIREMDTKLPASDDLVRYEDRATRHARILHIIDKSIIVLRTAMSSLSRLIENLDGDWVFYDTLMQHKIMLNSQIDLLIRQRKKSKKLMSTKFRTV